MTRSGLLQAPLSLACVAAAALAVSVAHPVSAQDADPELTLLTQFAQFGEPKYPPDFPHFDYVNPDAPIGGTVRLGAFGTYERLDTIAVGGRWAAGIGLSSDSLMSGSSDERSVYYPSIATHVEVPDDLSFAIFTIRPEATFHDGHPITAEDFVYALEQIKEHGRPLLLQFWVDIESATAVADDRIRFDFATTDRWETVGLAASFGPMPKHDYEARGIDAGVTRLEPVIGTGGYRIADVDAGRSIAYERVDDWWGWDLPVNVGQGNFERIEYVYFRDNDVMFEAFLSGDIDFWSENSSQRWATGYDGVAPIERGDIIRDTAPSNTEQGFIGLAFNQRLPRFSDVRVREALTYLFDYEWTRENIQYGFYQRARSYFPNSDYGTSNFPVPEGPELALLEPFREELPPEIFTEAFELPVTDGSGRIRQELRTALGLFSEAGWEVVDGELTSVETGEVFALEILLRSPVLERVLEPFVRNLERAGIDAGLRIVDPAQWERQTDEFDFDVIYIGANFFPPPGEELRTYFYSEAADQPASANWPGIQDPVVDELLQAVIDADDMVSKQAATRALDRVLLRGYHILPTYYNHESWFAHWDMFGRPETLPFYGIGFPGAWWYEPDMAAALDR